MTDAVLHEDQQGACLKQRPAELQGSLYACGLYTEEENIGSPDFLRDGSSGNRIGLLPPGLLVDKPMPVNIARPFPIMVEKPDVLAGCSRPLSQFCSDQTAQGPWSHDNIAHNLCRL